MSVLMNPFVGGMSVTKERILTEMGEDDSFKDTKRNYEQFKLLLISGNIRLIASITTVEYINYRKHLYLLHVS